MNARELKHLARLEEWKGTVAACRSSGMPVRAWCKEQGIAHKTYYYWEKAVLSEAGQQMAAQGIGGRFVEVPMLPESGIGETERPKLAARLRMQLGELEVYAGADAAAVEALVRVLKDA